MILTLDFNNKNQYRRYPVKQASSLTSASGYTLEDSLIVNCSITTTYGKHRIYISQIYKKNNFIRIAVSSFFDNSLVGVFAGTVMTDYTSLPMLASETYASGTITIGAIKSVVSLPEFSFFEPSATELEESVIFCFEPPQVSSIMDKKNNSLRGVVNYGVLTNIEKYSNTSSKQTNFRATSPETLATIADKSSFLNNCDTPVIKNINGVVPFPKDVVSDPNDGNIYLVGVLPITFYGISLNEGVIQAVTENISIDSLCSQRSKLLPPINISGVTVDSDEFRDKYYTKPAFESIRPDGVPPYYPYYIPRRLASNFNSTTLPEYYYWPQFVKPEYYSLWSNSNPLPG